VKQRVVIILKQFGGNAVEAQQPTAAGWPTHPPARPAMQREQQGSRTHSILA
jgi:hypothetical protein